MKNAIQSAALLLGACAFTTPAGAQAPVAIVEDIAGKISGIDFMDYLEASRIIRLGPQDRIVLSYLRSCVTETVAGGTIKVGLDQSEVEGGQVERMKVACDARKMLLAIPDATDAAGLVFRGPKAKPQFTLFGMCPIVQVTGSGTLVIARLDKAGERYELPIGQNESGRSSFLDFATNGMSLAAGGIYSAVWGARQLVFKVDATAKPGRTPIVGRLLRLDPTS
jgi:hypothetical protein